MNNESACEGACEGDKDEGPTHGTPGDSEPVDGEGGGGGGGCHMSREQCLQWVREQLRALHHTNRIYKERIIGEASTFTSASAHGHI